MPLLRKEDKDGEVMERLTIDEIIEHCDNKIYLYETVGRNIDFETEELTEAIKDYWEHKQVKNYLDELKEYRKLEEQGLLLRLPCKAGDIVYKIVNQRDNYDDIVYQIVSAAIFELSMIDKIGKTVFLTKAEAEQKLKEMESKQ